MQTIATQSSPAFNMQLTKEIATLRTFAYKFTSDHQDINDLIQDTLVKAIRYCHQFKSGSNLKAWLFVIMRNTYINNYRKTVMSRKITNSIEEISTLSLCHQITQNKGEGKFTQQDVASAMKKLSRKLYQPIELYILGYKYCEIAEQTGIPIGTVKTRIHMGRVQLKQLLKDYDYTA